MDFVTGASGFIGHNVLLRAPREWEIVARVSLDAGPRGVRQGSMA